MQYENICEGNNVCPILWSMYFHFLNQYISNHWQFLKSNVKNVFWLLGQLTTQSMENGILKLINYSCVQWSTGLLGLDHMRASGYRVKH